MRGDLFGQQWQQQRGIVAMVLFNQMAQFLKYSAGHLVEVFRQPAVFARVKA